MSPPAAPAPLAGAAEPAPLDEDLQHARGAAETSLLRRVEAQLHASLAIGSEVLELSAFRLHLWPTPDPFFRNVAVPAAVPRSWPEAIAELLARFAEVGRRPRLEFFPELWPGLASTLTAAGLVAERSAPLMVLGSTNALERAELRSPEVRRLRAEDPGELLHDSLAAVGQAFGEPEALLATGEVETLRERLGRGQISSVIIEEGDGPCAGASLVGAPPVAELAGVWTRADRRRRGLARRVCRELLAGFFAAGGELAWLTAGDSSSERLYVELGFAPIGTQMDMHLPHAAAAQPSALRSPGHPPRIGRYTST
jgi:ribosomal protein S18 acetylase RimI-like enzyme